MGMLDIIKQASVGAVGAENPVNVLFGEVLSISTTTLETVNKGIHYYNSSIDKIQIKIDQKLILEKEFFIIHEGLTRYEIDLTHSHSITNGTASNSLDRIIIREGLKVGDSVLLLRVQGGQQYVIWNKVV